jgi:uncharacterized protein YcfL
MNRFCYLTLWLCLLLIGCGSSLPTATAPAVSTASRAATSATIAPLQADHQLTINYNQVINTIEYPFWGINYTAFWDDAQGSEGSRNALRNAGIQVIRFPGGEPANWYDWADPYAGGWSKTSTTDLAAYAQAIGAQLMLQTNPTTNELGNQKPNDPSGEHVVNWVRSVSEAKIDAPFWEIGNEADIKLTKAYDWEALEWYYAAFNQQAAAMRAANPNIKIFGPAATNVYQWWQLHTLDMFLERAGNKTGSGLVDGVSLHYYPVEGCQEWDKIRAAPHDWPVAMEQIQKVIATHDTRRLPVFISETSTNGAQECESNRTMAVALGNADLLGVLRNSGVQAVQLFGAVHGSRYWGLLYGTSEDRPVDSPTPNYFILPIWTRTGNQVLSIEGVTDPANTLSVYAAKNAAGAAQVVLINKTGQEQAVRIAFNDFDPTGGQLSIYELRPSSGVTTDRDVLYNGVATPTVTGASLPPPATRELTSADYTQVLPAYSLTLFEFHRP